MKKKIDKWWTSLTFQVNMKKNVLVLLAPFQWCDDDLVFRYAHQKFYKNNKKKNIESKWINCN